MRKYFTIAIAIVLAAIACKKESASPGIAHTEAAADARAAGIAVQASPAPSKAAAPEPRFDRMIIRTATVSMIVADPTTAIERITTAVEGSGGYVNESKIWREGELTRATLSLRVPAARLTSTLAAVRKLAIRVQSETVSSEEVTQEYVDLTSQVRNLEATEVELRELMTEIRQRARKAQDVLEISEQLRSVRGEIEKARGRMQYLNQMTAYSTINLELIPDAAAKPIVEPGWQPLVVAKDAGRSLLNVLKSLADAAIWFAIYVIPLLAIMATVLFVLWRVIRLLVSRSRKEPASS